MRFALLALVFAGSALAQPVPQASPGSVSYPVSTLRNVSTLGASTVSPANVGRYAFATAIGGSVVADAATGLPLPDGRTLPVNVRSTIPKAAASAAIGRFLRKGLPFVGTGVALYDLGKELGFDLEAQGGQIVMTKPLEGYNGKFYRIRGTTYPLAETPQLACDYYAPVFGTAMTIVPNYPEVGPYNYGCKRANNLGSIYTMDSYDPPSGYTPTQSPATVEQFEQAINNKTNWSSASPLARTLVDAFKDGETYTPQPDSVTGPASTPGPVKTTTDAVNNTTKTESTRYDHTYSGPNVTTTINTTTVTVDNSTGATITNTTTTEQPALPDSPQEEEQDDPFSNAELPTIPKLYDPEFPDGLQGVWNDRKAQLLDTSLFQLIPSLMPNMGDGGCPTWSIPSIYGGNLNASVPCNVWYFIRLVIILSALLLARRLIFGG